MASSKRWRRGTYMQLKSVELLRAFVGDPRVDPSKKISGRRLARAVGVHPSYIDHLTSGRCRTAKPITAERISEALGVPVTVLFDPKTPSVTRDSHALQESA